MDRVRRGTGVGGSCKYGNEYDQFQASGMV